MQTSHWVALLVFVLAVYFKVITIDITVDWSVNDETPSHQTPFTAPSPHQHIGSNAVIQRRFDVPRVDGSDASFDYAELIKRGLPTIIENSPVKTWAALKLWTPDYLKSNLRKSLKGVRKSKQNTFVTAAIKSGQLAPPETLRNNFESLNITFAEMLDLHEKDPSTFMYWSGSLSDWDQQVRADIRPNKFLMTSDNSAVGMWVSTAGVVANTHYDRSENFHVMLTGRKKFIIFAPTSHRGLYTYPSIHPHYHQSQVDVTAKESLMEYPLFPTEVALEFILEPSEILYIPPFWFHRVESLEFSVSASFLAPSLHESICSNALWAPLPFKNDWPLFKRTLAASSAIEFIASAVFNRTSKFITRDVLLNSRYYPMRSVLKSRATVLDYFENSMCYKSSLEPDLIVVNGDERYAQDGPQFPLEIGPEIYKVLESTVQDLMLLPVPIAEICVANLAENVIKWAVGSSDVISYLTYC